MSSPWSVSTASATALAHAAAEKYIHPDNMALLVVGKAADFDKPVATFGEVTEIDITIPEPGASTAGPVVASAEGRELMKKVLGAYGTMEQLTAVKSYKQMDSLTRGQAPLGVDPGDPLRPAAGQRLGTQFIEPLDLILEGTGH